MGRELRYMVTAAPGTYGDIGYVWSRHYTLDAALRAARNGGVVRRGALPKGRTMYSADEPFHPVVRRGEVA